MEMATYTFHPIPPYNFFHMLQRLKYARHELYRFDPDGAVIRTLTIRQDEAGTCESSAGTWQDTGKRWRRLLTRTTWNHKVWEPELRVDVILEEGDESLTSSEEKLVVRQLAHIWMVDVDLTPYYEQMASDLRLAPIVKKFEGYRPPLDGSLFESMIKTIIGQQLNLAFARKLNERLIQLAAPPFFWKGEAYPVFPQPEELASLDVAQLRALQFSQRKAEYVIHLARSVANHELCWPSLEEALNKPDEEYFLEWQTIRGVGRWTVECVLIFGLGRPDLLPAADIGLRNAVRKVYQLPEQPTEEQIRELGRSWKPWSSYVTLYLWESLVQGQFS